jgi:hypothetical protein
MMRAGDGLVIFSVSDLHLHDDPQPYMYTPAKERVLCAVARAVLDEPEAVLVLSGDVLDLTGMNPPLHGVREFFAATLPAARVDEALAAAGKPRDAAERVRAVAAKFVATFDALGELARAGRLQFIPGNHDWEAHCTDGGRHELALALGITPRELPVHPEYYVGGIWVGAHGHHFDPSNQTLASFTNPGQVITAILYKALAPALRILGMPEEQLVAIPAVRPEENIVDGIREAVGDGEAAIVLRALVRLLYDNGYFSGVARAEVWAALHVTPHLLTPDRVRARLADDTDIKTRFAAIADDIVHGRIAGFPHPHTRMVVFGHTHEWDFADGSYVNTGTWIDHVDGLTKAALARPDRTLPLLRIEGDDVALYDVRGLGDAHRRPQDCAPLARFALAGGKS